MDIAGMMEYWLFRLDVLKTRMQRMLDIIESTQTAVGIQLFFHRRNLWERIESAYWIFRSPGRTIKPSKGTMHYETVPELLFRTAEPHTNVPML